MNDEIILRIENLQKYFQEDESIWTRIKPGVAPAKIRAVDGVSLAVKQGETLGIVGESGCGKSTLARAALQLIEPTAGQVIYDGDDVTQYSKDEFRSFRSKVQMIFQDPFASLNPRFTVKRTLIEPMQIHNIGDSQEERVELAGELLQQVGLAKEHLSRYPHEFSGGQRQRIAIARALSVKPDLLVADEPVSALDVSVQARILNLLEELQEQMDLSMVFISHDLSVVRQICDRIGVMYLGEIVELGPTDQVFSDARHPYTQTLVSSIPIPDPTMTDERIPLKGDVPDPDDPPKGCRFHPRCPKVIPPAEWPSGQDDWRRVLRLKENIGNSEIDPTAVKERLESETTATVTDEEVVTEIYQQYIATAEDKTSLPTEVEETVQDALVMLVDGDAKASYNQLDKYQSVCESKEPERLDLGDDELVRCHLHDEDQPSNPITDCLEVE